MTGLRLLAFGDPTEAWGVACLADESAPPRLAVRLGAAAAVFDVTLEPAEDGAWRLEGDGVSLLFSGTIPPIASRADESDLERSDQLSEVSGRLEVDGQGVEVGCRGWMSSVQGEAVLSHLDSLRFLAAWLDARAGFSLTALRPRKARGHEADAVAASVVGDPPRRVVDPRLSTTYTKDGLPARAGLELWLEPEDEGSDDQPAFQYPRRAAGEVAGASLDWNQGDLALHASPLRWHSHGQQGPGVYVLGRRR